jgi:hypothetical protein
MRRSYFCAVDNPSSVIDGDAKGLAPSERRIECPECHKKMLLKVGLEPDTTKNEINCIRCHHPVIPLVPGPIIGGPFSVDA